MLLYYVWEVFQNVLRFVCNMKKVILNGYVYGLSIDSDNINVKDIKTIHELLTKNAILNIE